MPDKDASWMYDWIDEFELQKDADVERALKSPRVVARLHELAEFELEDTTPKRGENWTDLTVVAGQGFNLSGHTTCTSFGCKKLEIDDAVSKMWHYFDRIVVSGPMPSEIRDNIEDTPSEAIESLHRSILDDVRTLNYVRKIGALKKIVFRADSWTHCYSCTRRSAIDLGLKVAASGKTRRKMVEQIASEAKISQKFVLGGWDVCVSHPLMPHPMYYTFRNRVSKHQVASYIFDKYSGGSVMDYVKARTLNYPLATSAHTAWLRRPGQSNSSAIEERAGRVALNLQMPTLAGLQAQEVIAFLEDNGPEFYRFQSALRTAVFEATSRLDTKSDKEIADSIIREFIEPELMEIDTSLRNANKTFSKKLTAGFTIGSAVTTVGLMGAMPLVVGAGLAAGATVLPQLYKLWDDRDSVKTSDMYFLWNLRRKHGR